MPATIRLGPRPGDLGRVLEMHGRLYAEEFGYDEDFEAHVAKGLAGFAAALGRWREDPSLPEPGWLWIAEDGTDPNPEVVGMVGLTVEGDGVGQVRWFLVAPHARGGLGRRLMAALLDQARVIGLTHIKLWTVDGLEAASRLYTSLGFRRTEEVPGHRFGQDLVEVRYDLDLDDDARFTAEV
ncbi:GNAT family N-acetyltransferase [Nocardioides bizhenqiangii]|uniref:GNAT family N-acetyltransferase n=1 Tax=Nocardioides bizhenqiangii TaxID=3095076 RepID=A0ABZ0ZQG5_9ACTN|nr:GNAT family N-acetyltransferase [Nocardioides sp. HM61]WQQ26533.1 GNAT family N-acetyltransferase [Nocardioides sp. HM61]